MTVSSSINKAQFDCNGSVKEFNFTFPVFTKNDIKVIKRTVATGAEETLTLDSDYSVTADNNNFSKGGKVTTLAATAYSSDYALTIKRELDLTQETDLEEGGPLPAGTVEKVFDKLVMLLQQTVEKITRCVIFPESETASAFEMPTLANRKSKVLGFDANGNIGAVADSEYLLNAQAAVDDAQAAQAAAEQAEADALGYANTASGYADDASGYADDASDSADSAASAATSAVNSALSDVNNSLSDLRNEVIANRIYGVASINGSSKVYGDNFTDESHIDNTNSLNEVYDGANDKYSPDEPTPTLLDSYSETNQNVDFYDYNGIGQAFTIASAKNIKSAKFYLKKANSPTGNAVVKLYAASGTVGTNAVPAGAALATSETLDVSTLTTSYQLIEFTFTEAYSAAAGDYCIVFEYTGYSGGNSVKLGTDNSSPSHSGNLVQYDGGWSARADNDACFYLYEITGSDDMTLISEDWDATVNPDKAYILLFADLNGNTLNTDIKIYASKNSNADYVECTNLAKIGAIDANIDIFAGSVDLSTGSGDMRLKATTHNSKDIDIYGWGLFLET